MNEDNHIDYDKLRHYAWDYFQFHASQRLTIFNFYILLSTLVSTGYFLALNYIPILAVLFPILLILFSFIFWKLDQRNRQLILNSEEALKYIEREDVNVESKSDASILKIFTYEEIQTQELKSKENTWSYKRLLSYSKCFTYVFRIFCIIGIIEIAFSIIHLICIY